MAVIDISFFSKSLFRNVTFKAVIPVDKFSLTDDAEWDKKPFQTLYLLHGVFDDCNSWIQNTRIVSLASERNLAVIFPSGENMFYLDAPALNGGTRAAPVGEQYSRFIGEELVELTRNLFPLSKKRDDTFIGGLSMGGFGAIYNGCKYHKTFSHIAALSPAIIINDAEHSSYKKSVILNNKAFYERFFGDLTNLRESEKNPYYLIQSLKDKNIELPKIYLSCGKSDHLFNAVEQFASFLMTQGTDFVFEKSAGGHDWDFWNAALERILDWVRS